MFTGSFIDAFIVHWTKLFWIDVIIQKQNKPRNLNIIFSLLKFIKFYTWENIFMLIAQGGLALQRIQTWSRNHKRMQNHVISKKKWIKKWTVVVLRILRCFCGCFEKHSKGKHKENLGQSNTYLTTEIIIIIVINFI